MTGRRGFRVSSVLPVAVLAAGLVLAAGGAAWAAPMPSFRGLGLLPGRTDSRAYDVSADGRVVVGASGAQAFRWTAEEGMQIVPPAAGCYPNCAYGVSADGSVVVGTEGDPGADYLPWRWSQAEGSRQLPIIWGSSQAAWTATDVSAAGTVVVGGGNAPGTSGEAFRWTAEEGLGFLGYLNATGWQYSYANAVTPDGSVVVGASTSAEGTQAFRWTRETGMAGLGDLAEGPWSWTTARAVSADGRVVVGSGDTQMGLLAFRWTEEEGMVGLGDLPGGAFYSSASSVSADGTRVVGGSQSAAGREAFLWTPEGGMQSLNDVLAQDYGLDLSGWLLESAAAITADGLVIVGMGRNPSGQLEAWIATIPEPGALALLALGTVAVLKRRCVVPAILPSRRQALPPEARPAAPVPSLDQL